MLTMYRTRDIQQHQIFGQNGFDKICQVRAGLPLAGSNSYGGGAVGWTWLFTCPHLYLYLIQELQKRHSDVQHRVQKVYTFTHTYRNSLIFASDNGLEKRTYYIWSYRAVQEFWRKTNVIIFLPSRWGLFSTLSIVSERQQSQHSQSHTAFCTVQTLFLKHAVFTKYRMNVLKAKVQVSSPIGLKAQSQAAGLSKLHQIKLKQALCWVTDHLFV